MLKHLCSVYLFILQIKSQLRKQARELAGEDTDDIQETSDEADPGEGTSQQAGGKHKKKNRHPPLKKSLDTILAEVVAEKTQDAVLRDRIEALLDGVDSKTTSKLAYGHFLATMLPKIHDKVFNTFIREMTSRTLAFVEYSETLEEQEKQQDGSNPGQRQTVQQPDQQPSQKPAQPVAQRAQQNVQEVPQQPTDDQPEDLTTAQMPPPPPPPPRMQTTPPRRPRSSQLAEDINMTAGAITIRANAEKRGFCQTIGLTAVTPVQPTTTMAANGGNASGSAELATLQTVDMAALPPTWDTVGPPTPGAMKLPSPSQSLQTLMETATYSPFESDPAKQYSPGGLVAGTMTQDGEDVEVTGDL